MSRTELWMTPRLVAAGAVVGFACGAGCGKEAADWNDLLLQGAGGAGAGAATPGVLGLLGMRP